LLRRKYCNPGVSQTGCPAYSLTFQPIAVYPTASGNCSSVGDYVYRGAILGALYGKFIYHDYCSGIVWMLEETTPGVYTSTQLADLAGGSYTSMGLDRWGELYICNGSTVFKIAHQNCNPSAIIHADASQTLCEGSALDFSTPFHPSLNYQWQKDGVDIANANSATYSAIEAGDYQVIVTNPANNCSSTSNTIAVSLINTVPPSIVNLDSVYCIDAGSVILNGLPAGGTFSGDGVINNEFSPSAAGAGFADITYTYIDGNNCPVSTTEQVFVDVCLGVDNRLIQRVDVFPNPSNGNVTLRLQGAFNGRAELEVMDIFGRKVHHQDIILNAGVQQVELNLNHLTEGTYLMRVNNSKQLLQNKLSIKK
jgi:hypothetical protein